MRETMLICAIAAASLTAAACASKAPGDRTRNETSTWESPTAAEVNRTTAPKAGTSLSGGSTTKVTTVPAAPSVARRSNGSDVDLTSVVEVKADTFPSRTYFFEPGDSTHVYWFESSRPGWWTYRPFSREGDRAYFLEMDGKTVKRVWFDEKKARDVDLSKDVRWSPEERDALRKAARGEWTLREPDEAGWRERWDSRRRGG